MSRTFYLTKKMNEVKKNNLLITTRIMLAVCGLSLLAVLYTPIWRIDLDAPQYPEGLALQIHANDIKGDVDIINGLNHYIGMKTLHKSDFPEFTILPYCIVFFSVLFLAAALANKKKFFYTALGLFVAFGVIAMIDFWKWEYNYGHNLDPHAAIVVPGMAYQPPLIGFKQLLNFGAYSIPDIGGWIFVGCGGLLVVGFVMEWRKKISVNTANSAAAILLISLVAFSSCNTEPEPLKVGKDNCSACKMTIADARFGAELVTKTGKIFKFDDIACLKAYLQTLETVTAEEAKIYFADYSGTHALIPATEAKLLKGSEIQCPMQGDLVAFGNADSLNNAAAVHHGTTTTWAAH